MANTKAKKAPTKKKSATKSEPKGTAEVRAASKKLLEVCKKHNFSHFLVAGNAMGTDLIGCGSSGGSTHVIASLMEAQANNTPALKIAILRMIMG